MEMAALHGNVPLIKSLRAKPTRRKSFEARTCVRLGMKDEKR